MAKETKPTETENPTIELTAQEKQNIKLQRERDTRIQTCLKELQAVLDKHNCYLATNGGIQVAGNVATSQLRIDVLLKG